jgi:hypothetical protein
MQSVTLLKILFFHDTIVYNLLRKEKKIKNINDFKTYTIMSITIVPIECIGAM